MSTANPPSRHARYDPDSATARASAVTAPLYPVYRPAIWFRPDRALSWIASMQLGGRFPSRIHLGVGLFAGGSLIRYFSSLRPVRPCLFKTATIPETALPEAIVFSPFFRASVALSRTLHLLQAGLLLTPLAAVAMASKAGAAQRERFVAPLTDLLEQFHAPSGVPGGWLTLSKGVTILGAWDSQSSCPLGSGAANTTPSLIAAPAHHSGFPPPLTSGPWSDRRFPPEHAHPKHAQRCHSPNFSAGINSPSASGDQNAPAATRSQQAARIKGLRNNG